LQKEAGRGRGALGAVSSDVAGG